MLVEVEDLRIEFPGKGGEWEAVVDGVGFSVRDGETVGLVGESGAGKTLTALALTRLVPEPGRVTGATLRVAGVDVLKASERELDAIRGKDVAYVFQEPASALDPLARIYKQVVEAVALRRRLGRGEALALAERLLGEVGLEEPGEIARAYPHQISGGQRQRVLMACALAGEPRLLVLDEPTSALDTVAQAALMELLRRLQSARAFSMVFISHDLALVARLADRIAVISGGGTSAWGDASDILGRLAVPR